MEQFERLTTAPRDQHTTKCSKLLAGRQDNDPKTATYSASCYLSSSVTEEIC